MLTTDILTNRRRKHMKTFKLHFNPIKYEIALFFKTFILV